MQKNPIATTLGNVDKILIYAANLATVHSLILSKCSN